jgi:hypothetical protein
MLLPLRLHAGSTIIGFPTEHTMRSALVIAIAAGLTSCRDPRVDANIAQALTEVGTQVTGMQQDYAALQGQVDSLRSVVARQDTIIGRLASMAGLPISPR